MEQGQCPPWQLRSNDTEQCKCAHSLQRIVLCQNEPYSLQLFACFCMTYNSKLNLLLVGSCQFTCKQARSDYINITANTSFQLNELLCGRFKRQGQMCGSCMDGYAPPIYSYSLSCVNCTSSNWAKYVAVSLLPVTTFYVVTIMVRFSATSPKMNGLIICLQLVFSPPNQRVLVSSLSHVRAANRFITLSLASLYGIWNLDFFRLVYTPFCLHPHTNTLQVLALDYIIAVYPLLLIALSYLLVLLYDRNVRLIVCLWKPFVPLFIRFRRQWNIRSSLVDSFATFFLLSYVKILSVSVDLLMPVVLYDSNQSIFHQAYVFNQGDVAFLGRHHLLYACLAFFFLIVFSLMPMLLLFLYPCSCFQVCLNRTGCSCLPLHTFMDAVQGHYKNGTNGTRDLRFFSGLNLLLRVVVYVSTVLSYQIVSYAYTSIFIAILALCVALAQPYKRYTHNVIEACFLTITHMVFVTYIRLGFGHFTRREVGVALINAVLLAIPFVYITGLIAMQLRSQTCFSHCWQTLHRKLTRKGNYQLCNDYECLDAP